MFSGKKFRLLLGTLTVRKVWNLSLLYASHYWSRLTRRPVHWGMPMKIGMEPTTSCNLRCPECPSGLRNFTRPTGMLVPEHFERFTDELHRDLIYLLLYFQGEPYLNPGFLQMAAYAVKKGIYTATSTNGHYLDEERAHKTVQSGIHEVLVSVDGVTQESYAKYRVGGNLEKVKEGIRNLVAARTAAKSKTPVVLLQFIVFRQNEQEVDAVRKMGEELGVDKVLIKTAQVYDYENGSDLIPTESKWSRYEKRPDGKFAIKNRMPNQCWKLWQGAEITWDGQVLPCCFDKDAQHVMGKVTETSFRQIWRSQPYQEFRKKILSGRKEVDICTNCTEGLKIWA
jgi:radical SAM protein with 4Fe4S-binding SPASM domain